MYSCLSNKNGETRVGRTIWPLVWDRYTSHVIFLMQFTHRNRRASHCMAQVSVCAHHSIFMPSMVSGWLFVACVLDLSFSVFLSFVYLFSSHFYLHSDLHSFHVDRAKGKTRCAFAQWGVLHPGDIHSSHRLWAQRPWRLPLLRDYWNDLPGRNLATKIRCPRTCVTRNSTMRPSRKRYLHRCSFRSEKNHRTEDKLVTLMKKVCCQLSPFSHTQERGDPCTNLVRVNKKKSRNGKRKNQDSPWKTKRANSRWLQNRDSETRISSRFWLEVFKNWMELSSLSEEKLIILLQVMNNFDEINYFFINNYQNKIGIFVKLIWKVFTICKNWSEFKSHESMNLLLTTKDHEENGTESLNWWWSKFGESGHPVFRATRPLSRGTLKSKGGWKLSIHFCADGDTIETVFRTITVCLSAQYLWSRLRCVWGIQCLSNKNRWDPCWQDNLTHCSSHQDYW